MFAVLISISPLLSADSKNAGEYLKQAQEHVNKKDLVNAEKYFLLASEMVPESGFYSAQLAQFYYMRTKEHDKAVTHYRAAFDKGFHNGWVFVQGAQVYTKLGLYDESTQWLNIGIDANTLRASELDGLMKTAVKVNDKERYRKQLVNIYGDLCRLYFAIGSYEFAVNSGRIGVKLINKGEKNSIAGSYSKALYYRSLESLKERSFKNAQKFMQEALEVVKTDSELSKKMLSEYTLLEKLFKKFLSSNNIQPEYTHRILILIADQSNIDITVHGNRFKFNDKIHKTHIDHTEISAAFTKYFIEAATGGRFGIEYSIENPGFYIDKADWTKPTADPLETWGLIPNHNDLTLRYPDYFRERLQHYDTVLIVWSIPEFNNANGRAVNFSVEGFDRGVRRGFIHIPANRMTWNGPDLILHEFFHVIENMAGVRPIHGYYPENRHHFPGWKGENGNDYYYWHLSEYIPALLQKKGEDFRSLNYSLKYPVINSKNEPSTQSNSLEFPIFESTDRLAADKKAAVYRTGVIDKRVLEISESINNEVFDKPGNESLLKLIGELKHGTDDQFVIAKRIHDWITLNIAYDSDLLIRMKTQSDPDGSVEPYGVLKYGRTNCDGYASLYKMMAELGGLEARVVLGVLNRTEGMTGKPGYHAWNTVRLDGSLYIVDCSANTRRFYNNKKYSKMMDYDKKSDHLFIHPEAKLLKYFALNPEERLTERYMTVEEFLKRPDLGSAAWKYGVIMTESTIKNMKIINENGNDDKVKSSDLYETDDGKVILEFNGPPDTHLTPYLSDLNGKTVANHAVSVRDEGKITCIFYPPSAGDYKGIIQARSLVDSETVNQIYSFVIRNSAKKSSKKNPVISTFQADLNNVSFEKAYIDKVTGYLNIYTKHPSAFRIVSLLQDTTGQNVQGAVKTHKLSNGTRFEYSVKPEQGQTIIISGSRIPDSTGRGNQRIFTIDGYILFNNSGI